LDPGVHKQIVDYIDDFYEIIEDPDDVQKMMLDRCI
jgi:hypothetical protein